MLIVLPFDGLLNGLLDEMDIMANIDVKCIMLITTLYWD